ncbi:MAG: FecR family protein [Candidatus Neomarinimicrobiota bacterium]
MTQKKIKKLIWDISSRTTIPDPPNKEKAWDTLAQNIDNLKPSSLLKESSFFQNIIKFWIPSINKPNYALFLPMILILILPIYFNFYQNKNFTTKHGENLSLLLPDNSKAILNSGSSITYKKGFNTSHRTLYLEGEAYFEVQSLTLPFIVNTKHGEIAVLGTAFNVKSRNDEFEVGVNSGQVKVSNRDSFVELNRKQYLMGYRNFNQHAVLNIEYEKYPGWINQKLYCKQTNLETICREIERIHNVKIKFSNIKMKQITITGTIDTSELKTMLNTIALLSQHSFKLEDGTYTVI